MTQLDQQDKHAQDGPRCDAGIYDLNSLGTFHRCPTSFVRACSRAWFPNRSQMFIESRPAAPHIRSRPVPLADGQGLEQGGEPPADGTLTGATQIGRRLARHLAPPLTAQVEFLRRRQLASPLRRTPGARY